MPGESPFTDEWRNCLRAHYTFVVRAKDTRTLETLTGVLVNQIGFREDELHELYVRATMDMVDEVPEPFMPDMGVMVAVGELAANPTADAPLEELITAVEAAVLAEENQPPTETLAVDETQESAPVPEEAPHDPQGPQQLSLF